MQHFPELGYYTTVKIATTLESYGSSHCMLDYMLYIKNITKFDLYTPQTKHWTWHASFIWKTFMKKHLYKQVNFISQIYVDSFSNKYQLSRRKLVHYLTIRNMRQGWERQSKNMYAKTNRRGSLHHNGWSLPTLNISDFDCIYV